MDGLSGVSTSFVDEAITAPPSFVFVAADAKLVPDTPVTAIAAERANVISFLKVFLILILISAHVFCAY